MALFLYTYEIFIALACFVFLAIFYLVTLPGSIPFNWPLVGMLPGLLLNVHRVQNYCASILQETGGTFLLKGPWFTGMDRLCTADPSDVHYIMSTNFSNFQKGPAFIEIFELGGDGIFTSDGELWKNQRKLAKIIMHQPSFTRFSIKTCENKVRMGLIPILDHVAEKGLFVDMQDVFKRFSFDTTCTLITGYDPLCLSPGMPHVPFSDAVDDAWEALIMRHVLPVFVWKMQKWLGIGKEGKLIKASATIDHTIDRYISMKRDELRNTVSAKEYEGVDLLTSYLGGKDVTELKRDDKFLRDNVISYLLAGRDTVSSALTWFLWLIATHPDVESKIREELSASINSAKEVKYHHDFKLEEVNKLVYLQSAICESLRLFPSIPLQHKESIKEDVLPSGQHVLPKMKILFSVYAMGRMKSVWGEDCLEFKPERWISKQGTIIREPTYKFLAFNTGPRSCLGKEMTFIQMKVVTASIIHNYNVEVVEGHNKEPNMSIILYMKHGLKVKVSKRWI